MMNCFCHRAFKFQHSVWCDVSIDSLIPAKRDIISIDNDSHDNWSPLIGSYNSILHID